MPWHAQLSLNYQVEGGRTVSRQTHSGPLRVLQSLYPEGPSPCHQVLVHPPGGLVGGDMLTLDVHAQAHTHAVLTTPGATRFYRSEGAPAEQRVRLVLDEGARMEWLPMETICHSGCLAHNTVSMLLAPGAQLIGWDCTALGLPAANQPFVLGRLTQTLEWPEHWLERGVIDATDHGLLDGPLGLHGHRCLSTLWLASGSALPGPLRTALQDSARALIQQHEAREGAQLLAGCTSTTAHLVLVRSLSPMVEASTMLLRAVRDAWRPLLWNLQAHQPRIWAM